MASGVGGLGQHSTDVPPLQSHWTCGSGLQFVPIELPRQSSRMLFLDPFHQDWCELEDLSRVTGLSMLTHTQAMLAARPVCQEPCQESPMPSLHCIIPEAPGALPEIADADTELQAVLGSGSGRVRLTPALAVYIFNQGKTKTKHTAALLSAEFGVSAKAIRDVWTKQSWAQETRPHWTLDNEQLELSD